MIYKIKKFIAKKIGAIIFNDLPLDIQQDLLNRWSQKTMDHHAASMINNASNCNYTK